MELPSVENISPEALSVLEAMAEELPEAAVLTKVQRCSEADRQSIIHWLIDYNFSVPVYMYRQSLFQ